jgi:hypothetical protein
MKQVKLDRKTYCYVSGNCRDYSNGFMGGIHAQECVQFLEK